MLGFEENFQGTIRDLQKCIVWPKKSRKGRQEWNKACLNLGLPPRKLNTLVKTT
jgi:hypothetical protein